MNDKIAVTGELHSREYKKMLNETEFEYRVCHECYVKSFEVIDE